MMQNIVFEKKHKLLELKINKINYILNNYDKLKDTEIILQ